jgi:hypothetical protein
MAAFVAIALTGIVFIIVGAFAPWVTLGDFSSGGMDHDGPFMLVIAALAIVFVIFRARGAGIWSRILMGICAILAIAAAIADISDVNSADAPGVGWGLYLCLAGGIVLAAGTIAARRAAD